MLVLLVEDDLDLAELVLEHLESEGLACDLAYNGTMAMNLIAEPINARSSYDVIVTDINMPKMDGLTLTESLRQQGNNTPILMLTARDKLDDKLLGFEKGADDYLVKPFELAELCVRINVLARRSAGRSHKTTIADLHLDFDAKQATRNQNHLSLSAAEWSLLECLVRHSPAVVSKETIESWVWKDEPPSKDAFKMLLYRLRKNVDQPDRPPLIITVRGQGIALRAPESDSANDE